MDGKTDFLELWDRHLARAEVPRMFRLWSGAVCLSAAMRRRCWFNDGMSIITPQVHVLMISSPRVDGRTEAISIVRRSLRGIGGVVLAPDGISSTRLLRILSRKRRRRRTRRGGFETADKNMPEINAMTVVTPSFHNLRKPAFMDAVSDFWDGLNDWGDVDRRMTAPFMSILAGSTVQWIRENVMRKELTGRFFARTVMVREDRRPKAEAPAMKSEEEWRRTTEERREIDRHLTAISGWNGMFKIGKDAIEWLDKWSASHRRKAIPEGDDYATAMHGVMRIHLLKLAMICAASRGDDMTIMQEDLERARMIFAESKKPMQAAARIITGPARTNLAATIVSMLEESGGSMPSAEIAKRLLRCGHEMWQIDKAINGMMSGAIRVIRVEIDVEKKEEIVRLL